MTYSPTLRKLGDLTLGVSLGHLWSLEAFLEPPGALLAASWSLFGRSWGGLGVSWAPLGPSWGGLGGSWRPLGRLLGGLGDDQNDIQNEGRDQMAKMAVLTSHLHVCWAPKREPKSIKNGTRKASKIEDDFATKFDSQSDPLFYQNRAPALGGDAIFIF